VGAPPCQPTYSFVNLHNLVGDFDGAIAQMDTNPAVLQQLGVTADEMFSSFVPRTLTVGASEVTPLQKATTVFLMLELFMVWAQREQERRSKSDFSNIPLFVFLNSWHLLLMSLVFAIDFQQDNAIAHVMARILRQVATFDFEFVVECLLPLGSTFITAPDVLPRLRGPLPKGGALPPASVAFVPTWLRIIYSLYRDVAALERRYLIDYLRLNVVSSLKMVPSNPAGMVSSFFFPLVEILMMLLAIVVQCVCSLIREQQTDIASVVVLEPLLRDK
jgi:hypothetical protein